MKIIRNIPLGYRLFRSVSVFNYYIKDIEAARNSGDFDKEREIISEATHKWSHIVTEMFGMKINVTGRENIPKDGPVVFISNHQGYADIIVFFEAILNRQIGFIARDNLQKLPYFGKWISCIRGVFIKRGDAREALKSINDGVELLKNGFSLVIFPEGTRSQGGPMKQFKPGSFKLATRAKVPIVPVTINGTYKIYEETGLFKGGDIDFVIHPAIDTASLSRHEVSSLVENVEGTIRESLSELIEKDKKRQEERK